MSLETAATLGVLWVLASGPLGVLVGRYMRSQWRDDVTASGPASLADTGVAQEHESAA